MRVRATAVAVALATLLPAPAPSQGDVPESLRRIRGDHRLDQWRNTLGKIDELLLDQEPKKAYRKASWLLDEMTRQIVGGEGVAAYLSTALVLRAIAAVQMGEREEGRWHWQVARQMFPDIADYPMAAYGKAGALLKASPQFEPPERKADPDIGRQVISPKKKFAPIPNFPSARRGVGPVSIVLQVVINKDGSVSDPRILESKGELTMVCRSFDTLRNWTFEPAFFDGKPVEVLYNLTVRFDDSYW